MISVKPPMPYTHTGVLCPSCNQKGAVINITWKQRWQSSNFEPHVVISHVSCGYNQVLSQMLTKIFKDNSASYAVIGGLHLRHLEITVSTDITENIVAAITQINAFVNNFFIKVSLKLDATPRKTACPLCGEHNYAGDDKHLICQNGDGHYTVLAREYLISFLCENLYSAYEEQEDEETVYNITYTHVAKPLWGWIPSFESNHTVPVAKIIYRLTDNERILVISNNSEVYQDYKTFTELLQMNLGHLFKVILKVETK